LASHTVWLRTFCLASGMQFGFRGVSGTPRECRNARSFWDHAAFGKALEKSGSTVRAHERAGSPKAAEGVCFFC